MTLPRASERLTLYLEQTDHHGWVPEFVEIVQRARTLGMAGATVVQGTEGFGGTARLHRRRSLAVRADVPVVVTIVDTPERIGRFLPEVEHLMRKGLMIRQPVEVVIHRSGGESTGRSGS